jgi:hypothetical protein
MGTEVDVFTTSRPSQAFAHLDAAKDNLAEGIGSSYGVVGYKGKVWTLRYRGDRHTFVRSDDGTPANAIDAIILRQAHNKSKSYYEGGYDTNASEGRRPTCAALDGITPDADVPQRQATHCAICPRNAWKTSPDGRKSRECTDYKRLAVLIMPKQTQDLLGAPLMEPVFLRVPPASLNALVDLGEAMAGKGYHYSSYITQISFDPAQPHPKFIFRATKPLTDKEAPVVLAMRETPMALRITGEDQVGVVRPAPLQLASTVAQPMDIQLEAPQAQRSATPTPQNAPRPVAKDIVTTASPSDPDNAFAGVEDDNGGKLAAGGNVAATVGKKEAAVEDVGEPTESDAALDARIAKMLITS